MRRHFLTGIFKAIQLFYPGSEDLFQKFPVTYHEYNGKQQLELDGISINTIPVIHKKESKPHGFRIGAAGKIITYSGDTEWTDMLPSITKDADLFLCECTFYQQEVPGHLSYRLLQQKLEQLGCKRILLTHLDEEMLGQLKNLNLDAAYDGMKIVI